MRTGAIRLRSPQTRSRSLAEINFGDGLDQLSNRQAVLKKCFSRLRPVQILLLASGTSFVGHLAI
ncbi:hypothetical protein DJ83_11650 [Halorubrum ezzemoulense]|uniref:Uncharacterized protein n=1 Tax=Halorubrum ezzemoulense TaxID=337243 RepID=A0A256ITA2_HALEZ|nr:hypothetical protein DJ83_11650 [Halorubrum ezzemoulense]